MSSVRITEQELDAWLNLYSLENVTDEMAASVYAAKYDAAIDPEKEKELLRKLRGGWGNNAITLFVLAGAVLITTALLFFMKTEESMTASPAAMNKVEAPVVVVIPEVRPEIAPTLLPVAPAPGPVPVFPQIDPPPVITSLPVPTAPIEKKALFSPEELAFYSKMKPRVIKKIIAISEDLYTKVEEGKIQYRETPLGVDPFVIRNFAITNLEYKVFLADLYASGRFDDLKLALLQDNAWGNYGCPTLMSEYYSDEKYNGFPVVNIPYEGALLFCEWLEEQLNKVRSKKKSKMGNKNMNLKVRLPFDYEWIHSAKIGYAQIPDCGGYNTIYDISEGLVDKSFKKRMSVIKKSDKPLLTGMDKLFSINRYGMSETQILEIFAEALRYNNDQVSDTLYPKGYSEFNKAGHVSEMILDYDGNMVVMGSCWKSKEEYLKMVNEFKAAGASPFVGFRVVITNAVKGSYKDPFW